VRYQATGLVGRDAESLIEVATRALDRLDRLEHAPPSSPPEPSAGPTTSGKRAGLAACLLLLGIVLPFLGISMESGGNEEGGMVAPAVGFVCVITSLFVLRQFWKLLAVLPLLWRCGAYAVARCRDHSSRHTGSRAGYRRSYTSTRPR
jgi:hypothetical protein